MARVKICPSCTRENSSEKPFCDDCGFALANVDMTDPAPAVVAASTPPTSEPFPAGAHAGTWRAEPANPTPRSALRFPWGEVEISETLFVGRDPEMSPIAASLAQEGFGWVSRRHAEVYREDGKLYVRDVGSANGTFVNGEKIANQPVALADGDEVAFSRRLVATVRLS